MNRMSFAVAALLIGASAAPVLAQAAPPPPGAPTAVPDGRPGPRIIHKKFVDHRDGRGGPMGGMLAGLTPEGRKILGDAMRETRGDKREAVGAARQKMLELLESDRLDVAALRRAMAEERSVAERQQQLHQEAMLSAFQKLSLRDRKAFAVSMRNQHYRMEQMRKDAEGRMARIRERWGKEGPLPTPAR